MCGLAVYGLYGYVGAQQVQHYYLRHFLCSRFVHDNICVQPSDAAWQQKPLFVASLWLNGNNDVWRLLAWVVMGSPTFVHLHSSEKRTTDTLYNRVLKSSLKLSNSSHRYQERLSVERSSSSVSCRLGFSE